jgi:two-component system response regulator YesN
VIGGKYKLAFFVKVAAQIREIRLARKLKEETGQTFGSLLAQYRLQKAIEMLQAGTWKVYEIAEETGFGDYKNFSQVFKKYLHTTPKAFMQEITGGLKLE